MKAELSLACSVRVTDQYPFNRSSFLIKIGLAYFIDTVAHLGKGVWVGFSDRVHLVVVNAKLNWAIMFVHQHAEGGPIALAMVENAIP